jgi:hypothetical protein
MPATIPATLPTRWYPERAVTVQGQVETIPSGIYTDHADPLVEQTVYDLRNRQGDDRLTHEDIAAMLNLGHWRISYNVARNLGRRRDGETGRDRDGNLTYRSWNMRRNMRVNPGAAPARRGARPDTGLVAGRFGIEIEFNAADGHYGSTVRTEAARLMAAQGIAVELENYNHTTRRHWKMTTDATVTGGECVSPIMAGDTASLDEVRDVIVAIKTAGGSTGRNVGMHVHHDVTDFTSADDRVRLVTELEHVERALGAFVASHRTDGTASCGATYMTHREWDTVRGNVRNITPGVAASGYHDSYSSVSRYRFLNIEGPMAKYGTVEFRGLGHTLHAGKVRTWVRMGQAILAHIRNGGTFPENCTPQQLVDTLVTARTLGPRAGERFLAECARRS